MVCPLESDTLTQAVCEELGQGAGGKHSQVHTPLLGLVSRQVALLPQTLLFLVQGLPRTLAQVVAFLNGVDDLEWDREGEGEQDDTAGPVQWFFQEPDLSEVRGLEWPRLALEVAAAGGHNLMFVGPPGTGKSMLARRLPTILPSLTREEALEVTRIHSVGGILPLDTGLVASRPFRSPHHTVTAQALAGGGVPIRPGEITLAHLGVRHLDMPLTPERVWAAASGASNAGNGPEGGAP